MILRHLPSCAISAVDPRKLLALVPGCHSRQTLHHSYVIPAQANPGASYALVPACAGMTTVLGSSGGDRREQPV
jgi:hypothetical protein